MCRILQNKQNLFRVHPNLNATCQYHGQEDQKVSTKLLPQEVCNMS
jgi:hypothetical protein